MAVNEIAGYTWHADQFCPTCIVKELCASEYLETTPAAHDMAAEELLNQLAEYSGIDRDDEYTFDSDTFPKVILTVQLDCGDLTEQGHERCGACGNTLCGSSDLDTIPEPADRASERVGADDD